MSVLLAPPCPWLSRISCSRFEEQQAWQGVLVSVRRGEGLTSLGQARYLAKQADGAWLRRLLCAVVKEIAEMFCSCRRDL